MELVCPAGSPAALEAALAAGADAVYTGFRDGTNARSFAGLNFTDAQLENARRMTRSRRAKLFVAVNTYAQQDRWRDWQRAVDRAADLDVDALIAADIGVLDYTCMRHPRLALHLSVQGSATNRHALSFHVANFGVRRAVLPRVLSLTQVERLAAASPVPLEVFAFGSLCIMVEGRCQLSSWVTGESPNTRGVCSPARFVRWEETADGLESRLNGVLIDRFGAHEKAGYPTICKGRYRVGGRTLHAMEEPVSLNTLDLLPALAAANIAAIKLEGRQRSPAYVAEATRVWRAAIDALEREGESWRLRPEWQRALAGLSEGAQTTLGAYSRQWQ